MIEITFKIEEETIRSQGDRFIQNAPEWASPLKKEVVRLVTDEIIKGEDMSFRTINPDYAPLASIRAETLCQLALAAIFHKSCELISHNYQPKEPIDPYNGK